MGESMKKNPSPFPLVIAGSWLYAFYQMYLILVLVLESGGKDLE
jgi:hypothetical protein